MNSRLSENDEIIRELSVRLDKTTRTLDDTEKDLDTSKEISNNLNNEFVIHVRIYRPYIT